VNCDAALELLERVTKVFYSSHGLFLSRQVRKALFDFRHFISDEFLTRTSDSQRISISKTKADEFRSKATALRTALRREIGVADLGAARELTKD
jgi:hypothetical protein